jgi:hypothetical protein
MKKILLIDGLGDLSFVNEQYKLFVPDIKLLYIGGICRTLGMKVKYIDFRNKETTKKMLTDTINSDQINTVFISTNQDNENYVDLLDLEKNHNNLDVFLLINDNFTSSSISDKYKYFLFSEKIDIENNILNLIDCLELNHILVSKRIFSFKCDYRLIPNIKKYTVPINIGLGCCLNCSFCSIANTIQHNKLIHVIEEELDYLFEQGCKYFFIQNHSFCTNINFIETFCNLLINKYSNVDYMWSFWGNIESLMKYDNSLCKSLVRSKLARIELGVESACEKILHEFRLNHNIKEVKDIIRKFYNQNLKSFQINLIIGNPLEDSISIEKNAHLIKELYESFPGVIDFQFNYFYLDNDSQITKRVNGYKSIDYSKGNRKKDCFYPSYNLSRGEIMEAKDKLVRTVLKNMKSSIKKMSVQDRYFQEELTSYGILSQIHINYLSKGSTATNYSAKKNNPFYYNSWDILDDIKSYTPIILSPIIDSNGNKALVFPLLLTQDSNVSFVFLNKLQEQICNLLKTNNYTISEIIYKLKNINNGNINENEFFSFLEMLEFHDLLFYTKIFN